MDNGMFRMIDFRHFVNQSTSGETATLEMCPPKKLTPTFLAIVVVASSLLLGSIAWANEELGVPVWCYVNDPNGKRVMRGRFAANGNDRKSRLILLRGPKPAYGCKLQHENKRPVSIGGWDSAEFVALCRDPITDTEQLVMHVEAGKHFEAQVWSVEPRTRVPVLLYKEAWGDELSYNHESEEWDLVHLRTVEGTCRWRERKKVHLTFKAAMKALRVGAKLKVDGSDIALPTRKIPSVEARKWLNKLVGIARFEGAVYADETGRSSWQVIQVLGTRLCDAGGAVLVLNREQNSWRTIYDVPSGSSRFLNLPMRGMFIKGDLLYVSMCDLDLSMRADCSNFGDYVDYVINLRKYHAAPIAPGSKAPGPLKHTEEGAGDKRFAIHDLGEYLAPD